SVAPFITFFSDPEGGEPTKKSFPFWFLTLLMIGGVGLWGSLQANAAEEGGKPLKLELANGMTVILLENHAAPVVAFQAWVNVGSTDETPELAGMAHVHEHMLFKGTKKRGVGEIAREVEGSGGDINAWTSFDQTVYHLVLASRFF